MAGMRQVNRCDAQSLRQPVVFSGDAKRTALPKCARSPVTMVGRGALTTHRDVRERVFAL